MNKRREEILSEIEACGVLVDVGCDHGYVGFECLKRDIAREVVFSDISEPSLQKAKELVKSEGGFAHRASFCVANGLEGVKGKDVDTCVIAGMGGEEIMKILARKTPKTCVLQPMSEVEKLRVFLVKRFEIAVDRLFYDRGKYYNLIVAKVSENGQVISDAEVMFGKSNLENPSGDFLEFAAARLERQIKIEKSRSTACEDDKKIIAFLSDFLNRHGDNGNDENI